MARVGHIPLLLRMVNETTSIVSVAQNIVRNVLQSGELGIIDKDKNDLQTKADRAAQNYIVSRLSHLFPKATIIGEEGDVSESYEPFLPKESEMISSGIDWTSFTSHSIPKGVQNVQEEDVVVWVDPLDGTTEFAQGITEGVTVLVGVAVEGEAVAGVIGQPFFGSPATGRTIWGIPGLGFGGIEASEPPGDKLVVTTTRSHSNPRTEAILKLLNPDDVLRVGGAGYKAILLMEGRANVYVFARAGCKKWDSCAPEAVIRATGGDLTDLTGSHYQYHKTVQYPNEGGILATPNGEDHSKYVKKIGEVLSSL